MEFNRRALSGADRWVVKGGRVGGGNCFNFFSWPHSQEILVLACAVPRIFGLPSAFRPPRKGQPFPGHFLIPSKSRPDWHNPWAIPRCSVLPARSRCRMLVNGFTYNLGNTLETVVGYDGSPPIRWMLLAYVAWRGILYFSSWPSPARERERATA